MLLMIMYFFRRLYTHTLEAFSDTSHESRKVVCVVQSQEELVDASVHSGGHFFDVVGI